MDGIKLKEIFNAVWEKKIIIIVITTIFAILGTIYTIEFTTPMYTSYTTMVLVMSDNKSKENENYTITSADISLNAQLIATYSELAKSKSVIREVISNLDINQTEDYIKRNVFVTAVANTELIKISVKNENSYYASEIANEIAKVFAKKVNEIYNMRNIYVVDEAETSTIPSNINHTKDVLLFIAVGAFISFSYVFLAYVLDNTIRNVEDIEKGFGMPVLITVPFIENFENTKGEKR